MLSKSSGPPDALRRRVNCITAEMARDSVRLRPWYVPEPEFLIVVLLVTFVVIFVLGTVAFFWWRAFFTPNVNDYVGLYVDMARTYFEIIAFYLLAAGSYYRYVAQRVTSTDRTEQELQAFLYGFWPFTARLFLQMYKTDCPLQESFIPPGLDEDQITVTEIIVCGNIFRTIATAVLQQPLQICGKLNLWRSWFRSPIVREQWLYVRCFFADSVTRFIDQNLMRDSPRPTPSLYARLTQNPVVVIVVLVTLFTLIGTILFWWFADRFGDVFARTSLYVRILESVFLSLIVLLIALDNAEKAADTTFNFIMLTSSGADTIFITQYPVSLPFIKAAFPCNKRLQTVPIPATIDENKVIVFNGFASHGLFQNIYSSLLLQNPPMQEQLNLWRSNFASRFVRDEWKVNRRFYVPDIACYIDTEIFDKAGCCDFTAGPCKK